MQIIIGNKMFASKKDAHNYYKALLSRQIIGVAPEHIFDELLALLMLHPNVMQKVGCGIDHFVIMQDEWGGKCFGLTRIDGSITDFSYRQCISPTKPNVKQAFREAIRDQIFAAKDASIVDGEVHHDVRTFNELVQTFLVENNLSLDSIELLAHTDMHMTEELVDQELKAKWQEYHKQHAVLKVITEEEHKQITKSLRLTK